MRLIDADQLKINLYHNKKVVLNDDLVKCIDDTKTAYSVDKVVEELEKAKHEIASEDYCRSINDKEKCDGRNCFECCAEYLIEIVKQGGVSDDVCEWNGEQSRLVRYTRFTTACGYNFDLETNNELLKAFRYCPFCGKKIKAVE